MQLMWKKDICCVVLTTEAEKEKGLFMTMILLRLTTYMCHCTDKFLMLALPLLHIEIPFFHQ